jgi:folate-binding protein YgfZ
MILTPLLEALGKFDGATVAPVAQSDYRGATTPSVFGNTTEEFRVLRNGCGVFDLGFRARISIKGADRVRWMNGMVTNNVRDLAAGQGVYAFLLNPQGRILGDMNIYNRGESLDVHTDRAQLEKILATFDHFIIMDDVEISTDESWSALGIAGPKAREVLRAAGIEFPELQPLQFAAPKCNCDCGCIECTVFRADSPGSDPPQESYEIWLAPKDVYNTWRALMAAGAKPVGTRALEMLRISSGVPLYGVDIRERDLPQETEQTRALNFNKGCYVGQEIVERIRSRGNVHRTFAGFVVEGSHDLAPGAKIVVEEKEAGEITSVADFREEADGSGRSARLSMPAGEQTIALGYIRREFGVPGREVTIGGARANVIRLPLEIVLPQVAEHAVLHQV